MRRRTYLAAVSATTAALGGCSGLGGDAGTATGSRPTGSPRPNQLAVSWSTGPEMARRRTQTTAVALDGELFVIGGIVDADDRATAVFDGDGWRDAAPPPEPVNHTSAVAYDGEIHVFGGYSGSFLGSPPLDAHWVYDPAGDEWREEPPLPTARGALAAVVADDRIFTVGGATEEATTDVVESFDPASAEWQSEPAMPTPREHLAAGVVDGRVYVAGGRQGLSDMLDATARYDPVEESWTERAPMPTARAGIAGATLAGFLFVFGGEEVGEQVFEEVEAYHPASDAWTAVESMPTPRWGIGAATLGGGVHTVGGGAVPSGEETRALEVLELA